ncbi:MAG: dockerin type I domain-containing protein, partial [Patescibacteria group bacterium]
GSSLLTVENAKFLDRNGNQIPVILTGGQIDIYRSDVTATPTSQPTPTTEPAPTTRPTPTGQPSAEARLFLESDIDPTVDYFVTTVMIDTDGGKAMAVDAFLLFDAIMIEVRGVTVGSSFGSLKYNSSEPGSLKIYAYSQNPSATHNGVGDVARVVFGIRQEGRTRIDFDCDPDRDGDSAIWTTLAENLIDCQATEGADYDLQLPVIPLDAARVNFAIKMRGTSYQVGGQTIVVEDVPNLAVRVVVKSGAHQETFDNVLVNFDSQAVGRGSVALTQPVTSGDYVVLIKGPVHLARRFCENNQEGHCWLGEENITLHSGENYFNWTGVELEPGDINGDGVVDSIDFYQIKYSIGQQGSGIQQDLNFNKRVDTQDLVFFLDTLSNRYEDQL